MIKYKNDENLDVLGYIEEFDRILGRIRALEYYLTGADLMNEIIENSIMEVKSNLKTIREELYVFDKVTKI